MALSGVCSKRAHANWQGLSYRQKLVALDAAVRNILRRGLTRRISPDAVRVGLGARRTGDESISATREWTAEDLALIVFVAAKRPDADVPMPRKVRRHISMRLTVEGKRRKLAVPTDVRTSPETITPQAAVPLGIVVTRGEPAPGDTAYLGVLCAVVRNPNDEGGQLYGLTCHHVACLSGDTQDLHADPSAITWSVAVNDRPVSRLGQVTYKSDFAPTSVRDVCLDAALVQLRGGSDATRLPFWSFRAKRATEDQIEMMRKWGKSAKLYSRRYPNGTSVSAPVLMPRLEVSYGPYTARIRLAVSYEMLDPGAFTHPGDSGSAITVDGGGEELLAMHFSGKSGTIHGYAQPAHLVMGAFGINVELV